MSWYIRDPGRFELEKRLLRQFHPDVKLVKKKGLLRIHKHVRGSKATYVGELIYPKRFPYSEIEPYLLSPKIRRSPHEFSDGQLCLHHSEDVGPETTGKVFCDWFVQWVRHYEKWLRTGHWD